MAIILPMKAVQMKIAINMDNTIVDELGSTLRVCIDKTRIDSMDELQKNMANGNIGKI
jgi:hypothetical protein